ncbi:hypothetical protein F5880DRAFT_1618160 [Lentinula raphanica]|nr:hypothetical protein F5880DRAFT_1618160 [Lentinula raphanica]
MTGIPGPAGQVPVSTGQQQVTGQDVGGKIPAGQVTGMTRPGLVKTLVPWSKTTREQGANVIALSNITALCPCEAFELHWSWNQAVPDSFSLFAFIDEHGTPRHMTKSKFLKFVTSIWNSAGMKHVLGHSF